MINVPTSQSAPGFIPGRAQLANDDGDTTIGDPISIQESAGAAIPVSQQLSGGDSLTISPLNMLGVPQSAAGGINAGNAGNAGTALAGRDMVGLMLDLLAGSLGSPFTITKA